MNGICEAKWREVHNTANILLNTARLGGAFFHHVHAYAVHIVNTCPAKNVIDRDGNPTTPFHFSYDCKPCLINFRVFGCPVYFKRYEPTFCNKLITYKQQHQLASHGTFIGFPDNSAGWLVTAQTILNALLQPKTLILMKTSTQSFPLTLNPLLEPNGLQNIEDSEPTIIHQTGSVANLGISPSSFIEETTTEDPSKTNTGESQPLPDSTDNDDETEAQSLFHHQPKDKTDNDDPQLVQHHQLHNYSISLTISKDSPHYKKR